jgi:predicted AAA+ superfamily ATPase
VEDRAPLLKAFATAHLEEEIRREASVKEWGPFVRFLHLAAAESGGILNYAGVAQETGISLPTVKSYYQLLEDMFVGVRVPAYSKSPRKNILSSPKFLLFDLGVRHAAAGLTPSLDIALADPGRYFEQWVGLELWRRLQYRGQGTLYHQRTKDGAEVDFIIDYENGLTPIEVKWTEHPSLKDARHLLTFMDEHLRQARHSYIICRCPRPLQLEERVTALPWHNL